LKKKAGRPVGDRKAVSQGKKARETSENMTLTQRLPLQGGKDGGRNNRKNEAPTEEASLAKKDKDKQRLVLQKKAMKRQKEAMTANENAGKEAQDGSKKTPSKKTNKGPQKRAKKRKQAAAPQGRRKVPTPGDTGGCKHRGLKELDVCDKAWLAACVKVGAWLHKKPCVDCAARRESGDETREIVLDASVLLLLKQPILAYICNCGPIGHKMEEGEEGREEYECDMMLCLPCYRDRESKLTTTMGSKRTRRQKTIESC
jgi:hypothetical protein